ncbi:cobalt-precorrin 5A hydrolase [Fundidesulfovibrio magnetotacticus]|uniref:cobalt-precorrin 5A hydrolase n=1 Tax=Fundidesulfovibrio magnetotacticus TaxID=2730080 RepID=UPI001F18AE5F|nr:cobalamin biosynthesis protein [Fundidesulfovibrio magnetotacticus]
MLAGGSSPDATPPLAVWALTPQGVRLARGLARELQGEVFAPRRFAAPGEQGFASLTEAVAAAFHARPGHLFVAACGIVVRAVAPLLQGKAKDPAVVVLDQAGRFAVSLLSGHLGGANDLARRAAAFTGGQAVITTATDVEGLPSLDLLARDSGLAIGNLEAVRAVNAGLLEGKSVQLFDPSGLLTVPPAHAGRFEWVAAQHLMDPGRPCVAVTWSTSPLPPGCLALRPRVVAAGVGCRRGTSAAEILEAIEAACALRRVSPASVAVLASIEAKRDEAGLIEAARALGAELAFLPAARLAGVAVPNPSAQAFKHMGVESVCEAAALLTSGSDKLLLPKFKTRAVTVALALAV